MKQIDLDNETIIILVGIITYAAVMITSILVEGFK